MGSAGQCFAARLLLCRDDAAGSKLCRQVGVCAQHTVQQACEGGAADLEALDDVLPRESLVVDSLASPKDLCGDDVVRALPAQLLQHDTHKKAICYVMS